MARDLDKKKKTKANWYKKNKEEISIKRKENYKTNKEEITEINEKYRESIRVHAAESIKENKIIDPVKWKAYCNLVKRCAKQRKHPYSDNFTNEMMFEKMTHGCFYCGELATTIDRIVSTLDHTPENCVGCCYQCNISKGNGDVDSFLRKAYYRVNKEYFDDDENIWSDNVSKPSFGAAIKKAKKQDVDFTLEKEEWNALTRRNCVYCCRSLPSDNWNGVDRIIPRDGYTSKNTVSCCHDCNVDKGKFSIEEMKSRNEKIAARIECEEIAITDCDKTLRNLGIRKSSRVCAYGRVYPNTLVASRDNKQKNHYIYNCLHNVNTPDDIFIVSDDFYEKYKNRDNITLKMYKDFLKNNI